MNKYFFFLFFVFSLSNAQISTNEMSFNEYLGMVKKFHPLVKIADLEISQAQANLMMARGAFDPKLEADFSSKEFKDKKYYSLFNGGFKIPTWYGIEVKGGFENTDGTFLNPQNNTPTEGLGYAGISIPILQGFLINQRMADLRKAKININLSAAERNLQAIQVLHQAAIAYFVWKKNYDEFKLYETYLENAQIRLNGIKSLIEQGDKAAIDSVEANITVKNRLLNKEDALLKLTKARLELSNYLWTTNAIPIELEEQMYPEINLFKNIQDYLSTNELNLVSFSTENHPKINSLNLKINMLEVDRKLKANMLLPKIDLGYNYLATPNQFQEFQFQDYKFGVNFAIPLFLRKERGSLKLAKQKIEVEKFNVSFEREQLNNKVASQQAEIISLKKQENIISDLVKDNSTLLNSEERLFEMGESSLFLINTRENNLVAAQLSKIAIENRFYISNADLYKTIANPN
ncbi:TolC family protein [Flavobacterium difficile]|uniref:TolC family protein n=1 Tax=Flavobacterium difficile TaxID=2709659 RepID=A0ABX0I6N9_9FLAO|nr:TolC family protein [Flavobacterium difficile]NHM01790.1 TolC family protein [Flavobacterium difficile]